MAKKDPSILNKRERAILDYIEKQAKINGYPPSVREIGKAVGLKSTATVHGYLTKLEELPSLLFQQLQVLQTYL